VLAAPSPAGAKPAHKPKPKPKPALVATPAQARQIAKLEVLTAALAREVAALESSRHAPVAGPPKPTALAPAAPIPPATLPFQGLAGGSLTGSYPDPRLAPRSVGAAQLTPGAVTSAAVADGTLTGADVADGSITAPLIGPSRIGADNVPPFTADSLMLGPVFEFPGPGDPTGERRISPGETAVLIRVSCPNGSHVLTGGWEWSDESGSGTIMYESHPAEGGGEAANSSWEWRPKVLSTGTTNTFHPKLLCLLD